MGQRAAPERSWSRAVDHVAGGGRGGGHGGVAATPPELRRNRLGRASSRATPPGPSALNGGVESPS